MATNENRVLVDVFNTGIYSVNNRTLVKTKSCAMDILTGKGGGHPREKICTCESYICGCSSDHDMMASQTRC